MKRLCVFCGSSPGNTPAYLEAARNLGRTLAREGIALVYGGARVGTMGAVADAVLEAGGEAIGVIPEALVAREVAHTGLTELHVVVSMHERKALMADLADGFVALPGGFGTFEEIMEVTTWAQLGMHHKPCGLLNVSGYYDHFKVFIDRAVMEGFIRPEHRAMLLIERDIERLLVRFKVYQPPIVPKWIDKEET